jgi:tetratricopeptide (TPR) repeat protein
MTTRTAALAALLLALAAGPAGAAPPAEDTIAKARVHFKAGEAFFAIGDYDRAFAEYNEAYRLVPKPQLLFNIGSAYRRKAETTHAVDDMRAAVKYYQAYLDAEPKGKGASDARQFIAVLGKAIDEAPPPEPAPTAQPASSPASPAPPEPAPAPPPAPIVAVPAPLPVADVAPRDTGRSLRIAGLVAAGVGVALVATGVVFGLQAKSANDDLAALRAGDMWDQARYESAEAAQRNMYIFAGGGAAAIAGGAVLYFFLGRPPAVQPTVTSAGIGVSGRF